MPLAILDKLYLGFIFSKLFQQQFCDFYVCFFIVAPYVVNLSNLALVHYKIYRLAVVHDIKPVPYILSIAVNGNFFSFEKICYEQWHQFFRILVRAEIIRASCDYDGYSKSPIKTL